jgi:hypothetical protein
VRGGGALHLVDRHLAARCRGLRPRRGGARAACGRDRADRGVPCLRAPGRCSQPARSVGGAADRRRHSPVVGLSGAARAWRHDRGTRAVGRVHLPEQRRDARLFGAFAPFSEGNRRARQHHAQHLHVHRHVSRTVGRRADSRALAAQ